MKIQKQNNNEERLILIGMIVDKIILGRISSKWQRGMFKSRWANIIANWCVSFYRKYEDVPMHQIESLFESWASETDDKETIKIVGRFLDTLSEEYEQLQTESNSDYIIDLAGKHFNRVRVERLADTIQGDIDRGKVTEAVNHVNTFNQIEMGVGEGINILHDLGAIQEAFQAKKEPLIQYPNDLGKFFKNSLERDGFISFMGPEGRGKSFWLMDVAYRAMLSRKRVVLFEAGDMSQNQVMRRLMIRSARHPLYPQTIEYPIEIEKKSNNSVEVESEEKIFDNALSWRIAAKACRWLRKKKIKSKHSYFRLSCHPNSTLSVNSIQETIQNWTREGWIPDVIVIDYADILNMDHPGLEGRDRINETWKRLRSLSQIFHCLVVTATQADAASYDETRLITKKNFSDDKRKLAHVTGMIGLNQTTEEKEMGVMRLNWLKLRDEAFSERKVVFVAGCLAIGNPAIKSTF